MGYSGAGGKLIHKKIQKQKISWHCPFNINSSMVSLYLDSPKSSSSLSDIFLATKPLSTKKTLLQNSLFQSAYVNSGLKTRASFTMTVCLIFSNKVTTKLLKSMQ